MGELWRAALDLVLGACCPRCGGAGAGVCRRCAADLTPDPVPVSLDGLDVVAAGLHEGEHRDVLLAWKVGAEVGLDALMAHHLASAVLALLGDASAVALVPVPSTRRSRRERGRDLVADLSADAASMLGGVGVNAMVLPLLRLARQTRDQHALDRDQRRRNVALSMRAQVPPPGHHLVLVDDVVTTGSTLLEAARALSDCGAAGVLGGAALAVAGHP